MNNQQILETAIQKAIEHGWKDCTEKPSYVKVTNYRYEDDFANGLRLITYMVSFPSGLGFTEKASTSEIIFDHDFAKALWATGQCVCGKEHYKGEVIVLNPGQTPIVHGRPQDWRYHLQQMVIAEDPIKYLGENL